MKTITETGFEELLALMFETREAEEAGIEDVMTFDEADLPPSNRGVVVRMANGQEFQLTIVRSR